MDPRYTIALARTRDVPALAAIERAAVTLLEPYAPASVLAEVTDEAEFREAQAADQLWVALADDAPVGFALVEMLASDLPHLEEADVDPKHGRRGVGTALVRAVCAWAARSGYRELTLTTYRHVPWNFPFYAGLGFEEIPRTELRLELADVVDDEARRDFDPQLRAVMRFRMRAARSES